jgi:K(+)-stimulated pyrophosphate-energized sodium pump
MILTAGLFATAATGLLALGYAATRARWIRRQPAGDDTMVRISGYVARGAMTFLAREYRVIGPFVLVVAAFLAAAQRGFAALQSVAFVTGAVCSLLAGFVGMRVATGANVRTTQAARTGLGEALAVAFAGGGVMGLCVVGFALLGLFSVFAWSLLALGSSGTLDSRLASILPLLTAFSLGASSIALFARVGGGIFTKAADIGADLVGKLEAGIPEDDPRNPATIADNVGDNVGDVAGMGADLFESYAGSLVGCVILGMGAATPEARLRMSILPLALGAVGVLASMAGIASVRVRRGGTAQGALNRGSLLAAALAAAASVGVAQLLLGHGSVTDVRVAGVVVANIVGLAAGVAIGILTELFTGAGRAPVRAIARASETGPATTLITGLGLGMLSSLPAVIVVVAAMLASHAMAGMYGVGIAGLGMLSTLGIQLAVDAYGPIADNAGGVAEMAELPPEVRHVTDTLDEVGNTTAAVGKGFAIGSAALTAVILFAAFRQRSGLATIDLTDVRVLAGIMLGAAVPYFFASMSIGAIGRAAFVMIGEVRRQFRERPAILDGKERPDYDRCIDISTAWALREMVPPGLAAIASPVLAGFLGGIEMLSGLLVGVTASGLILAIFMANSGGAWDNAKKMIESSASGGKGSPQHHAAVIGDTVGDPFKDTAGPSLNILIKLMSIVSLVILPALRDFWG